MNVITPQETGLLAEDRAAATAGAHRMHLRYGLSEDTLWNQSYSVDAVSARVRLAAARIVRLSVENGCVEGDTWQRLETYLTGVLAAGAVPIVTFSRFGQPYADASAIDWFARSASDLVRRSIDRWGPEVVREWFWCLGNQPNSSWLNAGLTFDLYRKLYEAAAESVIECLAPHLEEQKALVGGPAIDGFQPFWMDWVYRFANEIDNRLIGFVVWNRYGDWRQPGEWGAPKDQAVFRALLMSRCADYGTRARAVGRVVKGREILNICGEVNAHSDHVAEIGALNRTEFGAAYYGAALIHLMRGGADAEMLRSAASGVTPQHLTKRLCAEFIRSGDSLVFPELSNAKGCRADIVIASGPDGEVTVFLAHGGDEQFTLPFGELPEIERCCHTYKLDNTTKGEIFEVSSPDVLRLNGYGVAVLTSREADGK